MNLFSRISMAAFALVCAAWLLMAVPVCAQPAAQQKAQREWVRMTPKERQQMWQNAAQRYPMLMLKRHLNGYRSASQRRPLPQMAQRIMSAPLASQQAPALSATDIYGVVSGKSASTDAGYLAKLSSTAPQVETIVGYNSDGYNADYGGAIIDGVYHGMYFDPSWYDTFGFVDAYHWTMDLTTGQVLSTESLDDRYDVFAYTTCQDHFNEKVYGLFLKGDLSAGCDFGTIDYETMTRTTIKADFPRMFIVMGITRDGQIYGVATDCKLYKVNKNTGSTTLVGPTGVHAVSADGSIFSQGGEIDQSTDTFYWAAIDADTYESALYTINLSTGAATKVGPLPATTYQLGSMAFNTPGADGKTPAAATDIVPLFVSGTTTGQIRFVAPSVTVDGTSLSGLLTYNLYVDDVLNSTGEVVAGMTNTIAVTTPTPGQHKFVLRLANDNGEGLKAKFSAWVGYDTPNPATDVVLTYDEPSTTMTLTWAAPTAAVHGGYMADLTYNVTRYPDGKQIATGLTATTCTDVISSDEIRKYTYGVTVVNNGLESSEALSNGIILGSGVNVPYTEPLTSASALDVFTIIDANGDGNTWRWNDSRCMPYYGYHETNTADDWLITPPVNLEAGRNYIFSIESAMGAMNERIEVCYGTAPTPEAMTTVVIEPTEISSAIFSTLLNDVSVNETGAYYFGVHAISDANMFNLFVRNLSISYGPENTAPAAVTDLEVTPAPKGEHSVKISFTAPSKTIDGKTLTDLSSLEVYREGYGRIKRMVSVAPGRSIIVTDEVPTSGIYSYSVKAFNHHDDHAGKQSESVSAYVGIDIPLLLPDYQWIDHGSYMELSWQPVTEEGMRGGYVDLDGVDYAIHEILSSDGSSYIGDVIDVVDMPPYNYDEDIQQGQPRLLQFAVEARNETGISQPIYATTAIGAPTPLPYKESFSAATLGHDVFWMDGNNYWFLESFSSDDDGGCLLSNSYRPSVGRLHTERLSLAGAEHPKLAFDYQGTAGNPVNINVYAVKPSGVETLLTSVDMRTLPESGHWYRSLIDLDEFKSERYITIVFEHVATGVNAVLQRNEVFIDNINVADVLPHDLAVRLQTSESVVKGRDIDYTVTVDNIGTTDVSDAVLNVYLNDQLVQTQSFALSYLHTTAITGSAPVSTLYEGDSVVLRAEVVYADDEATDNNTASATVATYSPNVAPVTALEASADTEAVTLTWRGQSGLPELLTEDFETPIPWTMDEPINGFTFVSNDDGIACPIFTNKYFGFEGINFAYVVWNAAAANSQQGDFDAHSGDQYLAAIYKTNEAGTRYVDNDSWLISPPLVGSAQTIRFWVRSIEDGNLDRFCVLTSSTDKAIKSFDGLVIVDQYAPHEWTEVKATLPEGTKYFAIVCSSDEGFVFQLDDITYVAASEAPVAYKVYRDGVLVATTAEPTYTAAMASDDVTYAITAVYADGQESQPVSVLITPTGIRTIDAVDADAPTYNTLGQRVRATAKGIVVQRDRKVLRQ